MSFLSDLTTVTHVGDGVYRADADGRAAIPGNRLNGGYLLELGARALQDACGNPHPVTVTGHFLNSASAGEVTIATEVLRRGRHTTGRATLSNDAGDVVLAVTGTYGDLDNPPGDSKQLAEPPPLPDVDACFEWPVDGRPDDPDREPDVMSMFRHRLDRASFGWARGNPSGQPLVQAWARPASGGWDPLDLMTLVDVYPPPIFSTGIDFTWVPTLELTVQLRGLPEGDEWLACRFETRQLTGGYLEEDGEIRTADGRLIAISRQLALIPRSRG